MKFIWTNKFNLDPIICKYLADDDYDYEDGILSATGLLKPARAVALQKLHADELTHDYSDMFATRNGSAIHAAIEKSGCLSNNDFQERRFYADFMGFRISGKIDMFIGGELMDIKTTKVWKYIFRDFDDYRCQLSIYRWLLEKNGIAASDIGHIHFFFTDWSPKDARAKADYPQIPYHKQQIDLLSVAETESFIESRIVELVAADEVLPECTEKELWQSETSWAVYKLNKDGSRQARAWRVCGSKEEAERISSEILGTVECRPGKVKRCAYCTASPFCDQRARLAEAGLLME